MQRDKGKGIVANSAEGFAPVLGISCSSEAGERRAEALPLAQAGTPRSVLTPGCRATAEWSGTRH